MVRWLNNMAPGAMDIKLLNVILNEQIRYVGVAVTGCTGGAANALQRQGFSASRGGLMTVMNTGKSLIMPGDRVYMELHIQDLLGQGKTQRHAIEGIANTKIVARLQRVDEQDTLATDLIDSQVRQRDIFVLIGHPWPIMPLLGQLARQRFAWRV
jgi:hypothetical protein